MNYGTVIAFGVFLTTIFVAFSVAIFFDAGWSALEHCLHYSSKDLPRESHILGNVLFALLWPVTVVGYGIIYTFRAIRIVGRGLLGFLPKRAKIELPQAKVVSK